MTMVKNSTKKRMGAPVRPPSADTPLAEFRRKSGLSQSEVGKKIGVTGGMVSQIERGLATPSAAVQKLIEMLLQNKL